MEILIEKDSRGGVLSCASLRGTPLVEIDDSLAAIRDPEYQQLNVIARLLFSARRNANEFMRQPERAGEHGFQGAALARTEQGRFIVGANQQPIRDYTSRLCAEFNAINAFNQQLDKADDIVTDLYFMGGESGRPAVPCASCSDLMQFTNPEMRVHMLPALDQRRHMFAPYSGGPIGQQDTAEIITMPAKELFRYATLVVDEPAQTQELVKAAAYILQGGVSEKPGLPDKGATHADINAYMMTRLAHVCGQIGGCNDALEMAVIRMDDGTFFDAVHRDHGRTTPPALSQAIYNAQSSGYAGHVAEAFYTQFRTEDLRKSLLATSPPFPGITMLLPDGTAIERFRKNVNPGMREGNAEIHITIPNRPDDFDPFIHMRSYQLSDLSPLRYVGTKERNGARPNHHSHGTCHPSCG